MQPPTTTEIQTAITVLQRLGERLHNGVANFTLESLETRLGIHHAARREAEAIRQTTHIETVAAQLNAWRDELLEQEPRGHSHHV
jgi:hypothetical protein